MTAPRLWRAMLLVALVGWGAAAVGIGVRASYGGQVTGDEPHYLLTAITLWEDRDLDVSDEISARRYRSFHEVALDPQSRALEGGRKVSPHDPLLPLLLAAPTAAGGWVGAKLALGAAGGALAALTLWTAVVRFNAPLTSATLAVALFAASAPLAVYGNQVYPEVPAALVATAGLAALTAPPGRWALGVLGASVVALPWLSVKYAPVAAALAALALVGLWRGGRRGPALAVAGLLAVAGAIFLAAHQAWYGGWTPYAVGDHFVTGELGVVGFDPNLPGRAQRIAGLVVDRTFGLGVWQPAWFLAVPALAAAARLRPRGWHLLVVVLAAGWLNATFVALTMHGWWFPGRQVVVVLPAAVIVVAWWAGRSAARTRALVALGALGVLAYAWLVVDGLAGRLTWAVDFFATSNPMFGAFGAVLPDHMNVTGATWLLQGMWVTILGALAVWGWRSAALDAAGASSTLEDRLPMEHPEERRHDDRSPEALPAPDAR